MDNLPETAKTHIVPGGYGYAFEVKNGQRFRVVDLHGTQIVDFMAWVNKPGLKEHVRMSYTRFRLLGVSPDIGEALYTNGDRKVLTITADTHKVHDMTFMPCFPEIYAENGIEGHRSCTMNITEVMAPYGITSRFELPDPFNLFMNSPNYTLKPICSSRAGDYVEMEAHDNLVIAVSSCPYDLGNYNGGKPTEIAIVTNL